MSSIAAMTMLASLSAYPSGADGAEVPTTVASEIQAYASSGDAWQETGSLPMGVAGLILVPLLDGRVLAFGGVSQPPATMPPQVFDPVTGSWSAIAEPPWWPNSKYGPIAVALADGRVLVAGGSDNRVASYLFDPTAGELGAWSTTQPMTSGVSGGAGALLEDGRVLAVDQAWSNYRSGQIFDPQSETWTPTAPAYARGTGGNLLPLRDGRALLVGGHEYEGYTTNLVCAGGNGDIYDPTADAWTNVPSAAFTGVGSEAVMLKDGRVLTVGGWCSWRENGGRVYAYSRRAYIFDPATGEWSEGASMRDQRAFFTLATLRDGRVLAAGGIADGGGIVHEPKAAEIYEPGLDRWIPAPDLLEGTSDQGSIVLQDGRVLVAGGWVGTEFPTDRSEIYTPSRVTRFAGATRFHTAAQISLNTFETGVEVAYIANAYNFPDALAGAAAAGTKRGPVLLAAATGPLHPATVTELVRLKPERIVVLGGTGMISNSVVSALEAYTPTKVTRFAGATRFDTAAQISLNTFGPGVEVAYIANAYNFPDALAGAAAAGTKRGPVLLAAATGPLHPATVTELVRLKPERIVVLGGTGMISDAVANALKAYTGGQVTRFAGATRFHTAAQISLNTFEPGVEVAYIANAYNFPDALAGAAAAGTVRGPVLLAAATGPLHPATAAELVRLKPQRIVVLGGMGMISDAVANALKAYTGG